MPETIVKSQVRFPSATHAELLKMCDVLHQSQNDFIVESVDSIRAMVYAETAIALPEIVIRARAALTNRRAPAVLAVMPPMQDGEAAAIPRSVMAARAKKVGEEICREISADPVLLQFIEKHLELRREGVGKKKGRRA